MACDEKISLMFQQHDLFTMSAREVFALIAAFENGSLVEFNEQECLFPNQIISLWDADEQYDWSHNETVPTWGQIGLGNETYLAAMSA